MIERARFVAFATLIIGAVLLVGSQAQAEHTPSCPSGTYDMLDWMTMDPGMRVSHYLAGNANPLYTNVWPDKFYWIKGARGFPFDIQLFDRQYIYLWITELDWNNPRSFKKFTRDRNVPLVERCAVAGFPGSKLKIADTSYQAFTDCDHNTVHNLKHAINELWGPYKVSLGGNLPNHLETLVVSYRYNCDENYDQCGDKEEFHLAKKYGLVQWTHSVLKDGTYQQQKSTVFNTLRKGTAKPEFECF